MEKIMSSEMRLSKKDALTVLIPFAEKLVFVLGKENEIWEIGSLFIFLQFFLLFFLFTWNRYKNDLKNVILIMFDF